MKRSLPIGRRGLLRIGLAILIVALGILLAGNSDRKQPIAFNHKKHVDNNVSCRFCHRFYEKSTVAGIPSVQICVTCHEDVIYLTPEKAKIQQYYRQGKPIPWKQIYRVKQHVYFSHRLHVVKGQLDCALCHGQIARMTRPVEDQPIPIKMDFCIDCHRKVETIENPDECIRCHR